jgi:hypothetical protein
MIDHEAQEQSDGLRHVDDPNHNHHHHHRRRRCRGVAGPDSLLCRGVVCAGGGAAALVYRGFSGYLATITGLKGREEEDWKVAGVPITAMLVFDDRSVMAGECLCLGTS